MRLLISVSFDGYLGTGDSWQKPRQRWAYSHSRPCDKGKKFEHPSTSLDVVLLKITINNCILELSNAAP